ncbi:MAG: fumarate hydratase [Archaeoglobaceae archaeon]|nr:fumarate hydratase [Archaeoglobaceae archaeon]MCX8151584.1 fumarate hydratase [Archaeoglobaceae archaeon]MDW8013138.1 fumarate hydratase [Archaeoglobaceae archaeon]
MEYHDFVEVVVDLLKKAQTELPEDVVEAIKIAYEQEENEIARKNFEIILKNVEVAKKKKIPICQDTGILAFFLEIGRELCLDFDIKKAIIDGVKKATKEVPLRPNAVHPITRENSNDNTGLFIPYIDLDLVEGDRIKISVLPKGAGSENVSVLKMMLPSDAKKIKSFIVETVALAGGKPCPPIFVGVGVGGTFDLAAKLAKKALLRNVLKMDEFEKEVLEAINSLEIGPMGMGGKFTALSVLINYAHCHTASLPVAVNIQCWANRRAEVIL